MEKQIFVDFREFVNDCLEDIVSRVSFSSDDLREPLDEICSLNDYMANEGGFYEFLRNYDYNDAVYNNDFRIILITEREKFVNGLCQMRGMFGVSYWLRAVEDYEYLSKIEVDNNIN